MTEVDQFSVPTERASAPMDWLLECSACERSSDPQGLPTVCPDCGQPWLVCYPARRHPPEGRSLLGRRSTGEADTLSQGMWRYRRFLPLLPGEAPVSLGEGGTPLLELDRSARDLGLGKVWLKDESTNPSGSFKARGLAMAMTRAVAGGAESFVIPTAGNAGVALAVYAAKVGRPATVFAPTATPGTILAQIRAFGAELKLIDGHIGDCGRAARELSVRTGAFDLSTLREPYRIEGKKTLGLELAEQFGWTLPDAIIYPAGGGTGLIGMWRAFRELQTAGWLHGQFPRLFAVQSSGCAPVVRAVEAGADRCEPWADPRTVASGLLVPNPLGGALMLRAIRETSGGAVAVSDSDLEHEASTTSRREGVDLSPEGGATFAAARQLRSSGHLSSEHRVILFNTGAGWLYRGGQ
ncbi:MAG TPA: threonine synthase [Gemmatimonadales bacterium]|nr:threonine synthase [Gemmatimonadales bacterium]